MKAKKMGIFCIPEVSTCMESYDFLLRTHQGVIPIIMILRINFQGKHMEVLHLESRSRLTLLQGLHNSGISSKLTPTKNFF